MKTSQLITPTARFNTFERADPIRDLFLKPQDLQSTTVKIVDDILFETPDGKKFNVERRLNPFLDAARILKSEKSSSQSFESAVTKHVDLDVGVTTSLLRHINGDIDTIQPGQIYHIIRKKKDIYPSRNEKDIADFPIGSLLCLDNHHLSYIIGEMCSNLASCGFMNFLDMKSMSSLITDRSDNKNKVFDIIMTEKTDCTVREFLKRDHCREIIENIVIQTLFAIEVMRHYGIQHNNLHIDTVMIVETSPSAMNFMLVVDGATLYIPNEGFLVKITNFQYATKYPSNFPSKSPGVGIEESVASGKDDAIDIYTFIESIKEVADIDGVNVHEPNLSKQTISKSYLSILDDAVKLGCITPKKKVEPSIEPKLIIKQKMKDAIPKLRNDNAPMSKSKSESKRQRDIPNSKQDDSNCVMSTPKKPRGVSSRDLGNLDLDLVMGGRTRSKT